MRIHTPAARVGVGKVRGRHTAVTAGQVVRRESAVCGKDYPGGKGHLSAFCFTLCETDIKEEGSLHAPHICSTRMSKTRVSRSQSLFSNTHSFASSPSSSFSFFCWESCPTRKKEAEVEAGQKLGSGRELERAVDIQCDRTNRTKK
jgi:hypothetical protein